MITIQSNNSLCLLFETSKLFQYIYIAWLFIIEMINKTRINLVVIGHYQSGKSTLTGHLLFLMGHAAVKEANEAAEYLSIPTAKYSWLVDKLKVER